MKYVGKPVEIDAWQFDGRNWDEIRSVTESHQIDSDTYMDNFIHVEEMWVEIPEGIVALIWVEPSKQWAGVKIGDYIVQDADMNFYPCERTIFERKYAPKSGGVITSDQMALQAVQQSSRFR